MVKETVQSIKAEKDKLKGKLQEMQAQLQHLLDKLKAKHSHSRGSLATIPSFVFLSESHDKFRKYTEDQMGRWFGVTIEFRNTQGQHMQIVAQNLLLNETDNNSSFCYSMI